MTERYRNSHRRVGITVLGLVVREIRARVRTWGHLHNMPHSDEWWRTHEATQKSDRYWRRNGIGRAAARCVTRGTRYRTTLSPAQRRHRAVCIDTEISAGVEVIPAASRAETDDVYLCTHGDGSGSSDNCSISALRCSFFIRTRM